MKQKAELISPEELFWTYYWLGKFAEICIYTNLIGI